MPIGIDSTKDILQWSMHVDSESNAVAFSAYLSAAWSNNGESTTKTIKVNMIVIGMQLGLHQLCAPHLARIHHVRLLR